MAIESFEAQIPHLYEHPEEVDKTFDPQILPGSEPTHEPEMWSDYRCGVQWATDTAFGPNGYSRPPGAPSIADFHHYQSAHLSCLLPIPATESATETSTMAAPTQKPSRPRTESRSSKSVNRLLDGLSDKDRRKLTHIISERTRRSKLMELFAELQAVVPALEGHVLSRKTILAQATNYLESLMAGNEALKKQLSELKGNGG